MRGFGSNADNRGTDRRRPKVKPRTNKPIGSFEAAAPRKPVKSIGRFERRDYDEQGQKKR